MLSSSTNCSSILIVALLVFVDRSTGFNLSLSSRLATRMSAIDTNEKFNFDSERVVICGGGIIAASIAYHLTLKGVKPLIIERSAVAAAASGKSGGFLAGNWGSGPTVQLHRESFKLHKLYAEKFDLKSFRNIPTLSVKAEKKGSNVASWLDGKSTSSMMDPDTAQVTPLELTNAFINAAKSSGATVKIGTVCGAKLIESERGKRVSAVLLETGEEIECTRMIVAMGPWTVQAEDWFGIPIPMQGIKSVSIVYESNQRVKEEPYALFCSEDSNGCHLEVYPRPNGDVYICGCGGSEYISSNRLKTGGDCEKPESIEADPVRVQAASKSFKSMSSIGSRPPDIAQSCMRPCPPDALPIMGAVPTVEGAYLCGGHNCWGILWAPVSGYAMAELVVDGAANIVDLSPFSPARFMKSMSGGRGRKKGTLSVGEQW